MYDPDQHERDTTPTTQNQIFDLPDYPTEWTSDQRLTAYWHMIRTRTAHPTTTQNWHTILRLAQSAPASTTTPP